jgi:hypothetical protein
MSETFVLIRLFADSPKTVRRMRRYLNENTRPSSEEKIPNEDSIDFRALELLESPFDMKGKGNRLDAWFEFIDEDQMWDICKVILGVNGFVHGYAMFADDEEYRVFYQCKNGTQQQIYCIGNDPELDEKLWDLNWDIEAMELVIEKYGG